MHRHHSTRRGFLGLMGAVLACPALVQADTLESLSGNAFGTTWRIVGPGGAGLDRLRPALDALFEGIDRDMSPWRPDSAISHFNASSAGAEVGPEVIEVAQMALRLANDSAGAFDPTVGPLVARWGFGPIARGGAPDWRGLEVRTGRIDKTHSDFTLDLCGIAKGRALDRAVDLARSLGMDSLLFDLGGELCAVGRHPSGRDWQVAVEHPQQGRPAPAVLHLPEDRAVATSGLSAQSYTLGGQVWGHIIDPATRSPVKGKLRAVTVLSDTAMIADGWATALFAAGDTIGPELARTMGIAALFLYDDGAVLRRVETGGIAAVLT